MTAPIPRRPRREILSDDGEHWLRAEPGHGAFPYFGQNLPEVWAAHADRIVGEHVRDWPGTRPLRWWQYSAPEPRRRVGGIGTPLHECSGTARYLHYGVPASWRRSGDCFSQGVPIDPANPPKFEAQASYLLRLGLLLPGERALLCPRDFWPEQIEP